MSGLMLIFVFHPETNGPLAWINHSYVIYCMVNLSLSGQIIATLQNMAKTYV